ncbi:MAG: ATPase [Thermoanaerobaculia bacterium]
MEMHVIFVEPTFPHNQRQFVRGLRSAGARVTGIGEAPAEALPSEIGNWLYRYEQVPSVVHEPSLLEAVKRIQADERVDRMEATVEAHIMAAARVREACGIPGISVQTSFLCRDKPAMKEALRAGGVACAQSTGADNPDEVRDFARTVGYPLIIKPRDGAGAAGTWRVTDDGELENAIRESHVDRGASVAVEEFIEGHEGFFDTICVEGEIVHSFISHYYPNVLEAMRTRWISPQLISTNRLDAPGYDEVKAMGKKVIDLLKIGTSATHMEWFFGPKGLKFSEIGCRPPGVGAWDLYCAGHEMDVYCEWGMAIVHGRRQQQASSGYAAGLINLRPDRDGRIAAYEGIELLEQLNETVIDSHFPPIGSPTQPVEAGYMANAWVRMRHPDYDQLCRLLDTVGQTVKVRAA